MYTRRLLSRIFVLAASVLAAWSPQTTFGSRLAVNGRWSAPRVAERWTRRLRDGSGGLLRLGELQQSAVGHFEPLPTDRSQALSGLSPEESRYYSQFVRPHGRTCIVGCGSGRDLIPYVDAGHNVVGVEPDLAAAAALRQCLEERGQRATIIGGLIQDVALDGSFDTVIFSPHVYSFMPGRAQRIQVLEKIVRHLGPDGRVAINFMPRDHLAVDHGVMAAAARMARSDYVWEPHDVVRLARGRQGRYVVFEHHFDHDELRNEAREAGLVPVAIESDGPIALEVFAHARPSPAA